MKILENRINGKTPKLVEFNKLILGGRYEKNSAFRWENFRWS